MIDAADFLTVATFPPQIQVELCRDGNSKTRWVMWVTQRGRRAIRKDFATPRSSITVAAPQRLVRRADRWMASRRRPAPRTWIGEQREQREPRRD
jgi:hypothetical protein